MSSLSELEYSALAAQTGVSGITLDAQRVRFYDSQTGKSGSSPLQAETAFLIQETGLTTTNSETLWRTYLINQGVTYQANLNDMKRDFWLNYGYQNLSNYIKSLSGLVAYYPLDETSGDAINQAPDTLGTLDGTVTGATQGVAGLSGTAYSFDGTNDKVSVANNASLNQLTGTWFFIANLNANMSGNGNSIMSRNDEGSSASGINIHLSANNVIAVQIKSGATARATFTATTQLNTTDYYFVALTFIDNGECKLFVNGVEEGSATMSGTFTFNGTPLQLGENADAYWADYNGLLQHAGIVSRVLDDAEILEMAQLAGLA